MQAQIGQLMQKGAVNFMQNQGAGNLPAGGPAIRQGNIPAIPPVLAGQTNQSPNGMPPVSGGPPSIAQIAQGNPNPGGGMPGGAPQPGMPPGPMLLPGRTAGGMPGGHGIAIPGAHPVMPKIPGVGNAVPSAIGSAPPGAVARLIAGQGHPRGRGIPNSR